MENEPLVSVIIPVYNRPEFLEFVSIPGVIAQTYKNWELWVVDDGSTEDVKSVVEKFQKTNSNIFHLRQENKGDGAARNNGIRHARGDLIISLDSDDAFLPEMIGCMVQTLQEKGVDLIMCRSWVVDLSTRKVRNVRGAGPSCMLYKKSLFYTYGFYDEARALIGSGDTDLTIAWEIQNAKIGQFKMRDPLAICGQHGGQSTTYLPAVQILKTKACINKYINDKNTPRWFLGQQFCFMANFSILLDKREDAENFFKQSLLYDSGNLKAKILHAFSFLPIPVYKKIIYSARSMRDSVFRARVIIYIIKYFHLYQELRMARRRFLAFSEAKSA
jgi:glycosyltransferase involved in cell wall biosynthesis